MAIASQGTTIGIGSAASPLVYSTIGSVISFSGPGGAAQILDSTNLSSTAKGKMMGLPDEGELTLECHLDNTDITGQIAARSARSSQTLKYFKLTFADSPATYGTFQGYVTNYTVSGGVDALTMLSITIAIDGAITWG